jgi:restriction endonuclease S subunit
VIGVKLKEICDLRSGFQGKINEGDKYKQIKLKDVSKDGVINYEELEGFDAEKLADKYILRKNDIIFKAKSSDNTAALVEKSAENIVATAHFIILTIKEEFKNKLNPMYLTMFINSEVAQEYFSKHSEGTGLSIVKISSLEELDIVLPSMEEQDKLGRMYNLMIEERVTMKRLIIEREKQVKAKFRTMIESVEV